MLAVSELFVMNASTETFVRPVIDRRVMTVMNVKTQNFKFVMAAISAKNAATTIFQCVTIAFLVIVKVKPVVEVSWCQMYLPFRALFERTDCNKGEIHNDGDYDICHVCLEK